MKALLMHPDRHFDPKLPLPGHADMLAKDLGLAVLLNVMGGDDLQLDVARKALLFAPTNDLATVRHRQGVMADCLANAETIRTIYWIACGAVEDKRQSYWGFTGRYPSSVLHGSIDVMGKFVKRLRALRDLADTQAARFHSHGLLELFAQLQSELTEDYLEQIEEHLSHVKFKEGVLVSGELGPGNRGVHFVLRRSLAKPPGLMDRLLGKGPPSYSFRLHPRDETGARFLGELRSQGINVIANAMGQSTDHILGFFESLRVELAFYVAALNLRDRLGEIGMPVAMPTALDLGRAEYQCRNLYDASLALTMGQPIVGNTLEADGKRLIVVTGANQGGKSSFLRAHGLAQLMMQCGLFVAADSLTAEACSGLFTHYKREEDTSMVGGKLDEELARLSRLIPDLRPGSLLLLNESFASTNEREGAELATQIVSALLERHVRVVYVTHLYAFANHWHQTRRADVLFLRAERRADGLRTFRLVCGGPLETSFGGDLYREIFGPGDPPSLRAAG